MPSPLSISKKEELYGHIDKPSIVSDLVIVPKGAMITCSKCKHTDITAQIMARKKFRCSKCSSPTVQFNETALDLLPVVSPAEPKPEATPEVTEETITDKEEDIIKAHSAGDFASITKEMTSKELIEAYKDIENFPDGEAKAIKAEWDKRAIPKPTEEPKEEKPVPGGSGVFDDIQKELDVKDDVKKEVLKEKVKKRTKEAKKKLSKKDQEQYDKVMLMSGGVEGFAHIVVDFEEDIAEFFVHGYKMSQDRKKSLNDAWTTVLNFYLDDLLKWVKFLPLLFLLMAQVGFFKDVMREAKKQREELKVLKKVKASAEAVIENNKEPEPVKEEEAETVKLGPKPKED